MDYVHVAAANALLESGLTTEAEYYSRKGLDWEEQQEQRKREAEGRTARGLPALATKGEKPEATEE